MKSLVLALAFCMGGLVTPVFAETQPTIISVEAFGVINNDSEFLPELVQQIFPNYELRIYSYFSHRRVIKVTVWDGENLIAEFSNAEYGGFDDAFYYGTKIKDEFGGYVGKLVKNLPVNGHDYCHVGDLKLATIFCHGRKSTRIQYWINGKPGEKENALLLTPESKVFAIRWYTIIKGPPLED